MIHWEGRERNHADEFADYDESGYETCGGCGREGRSHRARTEGRECECGAVLCKTCWKHTDECQACRRKENARADL